MREASIRDWPGRLWLRLTVLGPLLLGTAACSSATDERQTITNTAEEYCQNSCAKAHTCNDAVDPAACRASCQAELAAKPKLRADLLGYVAGCIDSSICSSASAGKCTREAQAQLAASRVGQTFCNALLAAGSKCDETGATYPETACLEAAKSYDDSVLEDAQDCLSQSCETLAACLAQEIPDVSLPR